MCPKPVKYNTKRYIVILKYQYIETLNVNELFHTLLCHCLFHSVFTVMYMKSKKLIKR